MGRVARRYHSLGTCPGSQLPEIPRRTVAPTRPRRPGGSSTAKLICQIRGHGCVPRAQHDLPSSAPRTCYIFRIIIAVVSSLANQGSKARWVRGVSTVVDVRACFVLSRYVNHGPLMALQVRLRNTRKTDSAVVSGL